MKKNTLIKIAAVIVVLLLISGSSATAFYFYRQYQQIKQNPNIVSQQEVKVVTQAIAKFMDLPNNEEPSIATITDQSKLKEQEFFKNAKNGDKVLIYPKARKAILYRPSTNRVIEFAPIAIGDQQQPTSGQESVEQTSVTIFNGTSVAGLTADVEAKLKAIQGIAVVGKENAAKHDYKKTIVVDIAGTKKDAAEKIAAALGGEVGQLPSGERKPDGDILVIATK